jgi:hypothetical protein
MPPGVPLENESVVASILNATMAPRNCQVNWPCSAWFMTS